MESEIRRMLGRVSRAGCLWGVAGAFAGITTFLLIMLLGPILQVGAVAEAPEPILTVVARPSPTLTPSPPPSPAAVPTGTATPALPAGAGDISLGELVEVIGTSGEGLRLRSSPGLDSEVSFLGFENEVFEVRDGPVDRDGFVWWFLANPYDTSKQGWAVSIYLRSLEGN